MNLYIRFFDKEIIATNFNEITNFLNSIPEIEINNEIIDEIQSYAESDIKYPKRYKIRPHVYFIIIKTDATTLEEFKSKRIEKDITIKSINENYPTIEKLTLSNEKQGWYEGTINFKRVIMSPKTGKFEYKDTMFIARCKANSGQDCYNRIVDHLKQRVDERSQYPAARGKNFNFHYLGYWK